MKPGNHTSLTPRRSTAFTLRGIDLVLATSVLLLSVPIQVVVGSAVALTVGRPVLFTQQRTGRHEITFKAYKFRTMRDVYDDEGRPLPDRQRVTRLGAFLRSTSLDELPGLLNVVKGEMSLVGPRPLLLDYLPFYTERERARFLVRPGLTGLAQISGRNTLDWDSRLDLDVAFVRRYTVAGYARILLATVGQVLRRQDVDVVPADRFPRLDDARRPA